MKLSFTILTPARTPATTCAPHCSARALCSSKDGNEIICQPVFERLGEIAAEFAPEKSAKITWVAADKVWQTALMLAHNRPVSMYMWNGVGQHTNATQTSRAIASLYALLGDFDRQGGNVTFPKLPTNDVDGKEFLSKEAAALRIGREQKPLGPPASPGNCAAYDIFTAILDEHPYPIKAFLAFGCNPVMSNPDPRRAREALSKLDFARGAGSVHDADGRALRLCFAGHQFSRNGHHHHRFRTPPVGQDPSAIPRRRGRTATRAALRHLDTFRIGQAHGHERAILGDGDIEAGYAYELAPTGITLEELKNAPGGISRPVAPSFEKHAKVNKDGTPRGFATPSKRVELYCHKFAAARLSSACRNTSNRR